MGTVRRSRCAEHRVLKSSWGIRISITANVDVLARPAEPESATAISVEFAGSVQGLSDDLKRELLNGVSAVEHEVVEIRGGRRILLATEEVPYNETDFRAEGLMVAMIRWLECEFRLPTRRIDETFDRAANKCSFRIDRTSCIGE